MRKEQEHPKRNVEKPLFWQYLLEIPDPPSVLMNYNNNNNLSLCLRHQFYCIRPAKVYQASHNLAKYDTNVDKNAQYILFFVKNNEN